MQVTFVQWNCQTIGSTSQHCFILSLNHNLGGLVDLCWHSSMLRASDRCPHEPVRKRDFKWMKGNIGREYTAPRHRTRWVGIALIWRLGLL